MRTGELGQLDSLLAEAADGSVGAFREFYAATSPTVLALLSRLLGDRFLAEDVLQDTMVIAWRKASDFDPRLASAKTWITTIARRRALDLLRSHNRRRAILHDDAGDIRRTMGLDDPATPNAPESEATAERLSRCFGELDPNAAACVRYAYLDGLTATEIADRLGRSLGTVKSWVRRSLAKLKECMQR